MNVVYGPVRSWRLGRSIGIDPISVEPKVCTFNCIYCQLGSKGIVTDTRSLFVKEQAVGEQLAALLRRKKGGVVVTFSGTGEPTLASNLIEMVEVVSDLTDFPVGILTNSSLFHNPEIREAMKLFDFIVAKLDAACEGTYQRVNRPHPSIGFRIVLENIEIMRKEFEGDFCLQIMFIKENMRDVDGLVEICDRIEPDLVFLNTPLRPSMTRPLGKKEMRSISKSFARSRCKMVYDVECEHDWGTTKR
ncbi:MAG: radical SAM protein [Methanomassiliicoccales archaeon]|nr:radical SAM protein [Methanomassiliicoccales archaeon]